MLRIQNERLVIFGLHEDDFVRIVLVVLRDKLRIDTRRELDICPVVWVVVMQLIDSTKLRSTVTTVNRNAYPD